MLIYPTIYTAIYNNTKQNRTYNILVL